MTKFDGLSLKQIRALPVFCKEVNVEKACAEVGISKQTFYQWMQRRLNMNKKFTNNIAWKHGVSSIALKKIYLFKKLYSGSIRTQELIRLSLLAGMIQPEDYAEYQKFEREYGVK